ncbi:putative ribonuclease H-like domain-containing protein [Tanacetum coccineum]
MGWYVLFDYSLVQEQGIQRQQSKQQDHTFPGLKGDFSLASVSMTEEFEEFSSYVRMRISSKAFLIPSGDRRRIKARVSDKSRMGWMCGHNAKSEKSPHGMRCSYEKHLHFVPAVLYDSMGAGAEAKGGYGHHHEGCAVERGKAVRVYSAKRKNEVWMVGSIWEYTSTSCRALRHSSSTTYDGLEDIMKDMMYVWHYNGKEVGVGMVGVTSAYVELWGFTEYLRDSDGGSIFRARILDVQESLGADVWGGDRSVNVSSCWSSYEMKEYLYLSHLIKDYDYYEKKMARDAEFKKQRVFNTVQLNASRAKINSVRPNINIGRTNVNFVRPRVSTVSSNVNTDHPLKNMEDRGIFDSGCSGHMTGNKDHLDDFKECKGGSVTFGGSKGYITGKGRIRAGNLDFDSVSFVKELWHFNLFLISQICDKQHKVLFTESECLVVSPDFKMPDENQILLKVPRQHNMYSFDMKTPSLTKDYACLIAKATCDESKLWHRRLGHINFKNLNKLVKGNLVRGLPSKVFKNDHTCVACQKGKQHRASCKAKLERIITEPLHTLHMDLFGPTSVKSINHASYCLVITNDCTRFSWVFFLATKDETSGILQNFIRQIENQLNHRVKIIRSDNGTEFKNKDMLEFCGNKGIKQEYSNARTPQQNGVAERMNRTLIEAARTMLADSLLPTTFWAEAVSTACYIFNRVRVTKPQNKTPYELLFGHKPIISYIRPFGCHVTILDTLSVLGKFDGKCDEGFLVGYSLNSKAFRVYNLVTKKVEVNLHVKFLEEKPNVKGVGYRWMFDIDYLTDSMNYIPVSLDNQSNPHAGTSEVTNSAGTLQSPNANASEEADEDEELIVVPTAIKHSAAKVGPRKSSTNSKEEKFLTELQNLQTQEKEAFSTGISEDTPEILAFRRDLDQLAQKHLREVTTDKATSTNSVNSGSEPANTQPADQDDSDMPELTIFNKPQKGIFDEASYDEEGMVVGSMNFNNLQIEVVVVPFYFRIHYIHPQMSIPGDPKSYVQTEKECSNIQEYMHLVDWNKWDKKLKPKDERGVVVRIRHELVVQGHKQAEGIDSDEVFALVARHSYGVCFLQPTGFVDPDHPKKNFTLNAVKDSLSTLRANQFGLLLDFMARQESNNSGSSTIEVVNMLAAATCYGLSYCGFSIQNVGLGFSHFMNTPNLLVNESYNLAQCEESGVSLQGQSKHDNGSTTHAVKGNWGTTVKTSTGYNWRNSRPNSNYNSGSNFVRTDHPLKNMEDEDAEISSK